ncbi:MAG: D-alanyl-D-alanine carboxypeptidase family protein [Patescibacteria group bacterium]|nr:D-alanyl-D-alanine carboxypeptidase family protein [Patescibacteria group bacterium]
MKNIAKHITAETKKIFTTSKFLTAFLAIIVIVIIAVAWYAYTGLAKLSDKVDNLSTELSSLEKNISSTTAQLQNDITNSHSALSTAINQEQQNVGSLTSQLNNYQAQVSTVSSTVSTLQKLQSIDPQLLEKYSKVYFLNENYMPASLAEIPNTYKYNDSKLEQVIPQILPKLESMLGAASSSGVTIYVASAYRSFDAQSNLKSQYKVTYGAGTANTFSADQGYSEHQLGTAIDFITTGLQGQLDDRFASTTAYTWLTNNAYRYGFTLSYPANNPYYIYEPWHWRFVGVALATYLHDNNKYFYDLDQRTIDTYLASLFD